MKSLTSCLRVGIALVFLSSFAIAESIQLDERPAGPSDWGYRPAEGASCVTNPPSFSWRPLNGISQWEIRCRPSRGDNGTDYGREGIRWNVHCPNHLFAPGDYVWQYRGFDSHGRQTNWSRERSFSISPDAAPLPMPSKTELLARIPTEHPRLFVRPEQLPRLRELAKGELKPQYDALVAACEHLMKDPPPTEEPPKYGNYERKSEAWREVWWGNRTYTIRALDGAATLAFTRLLGGNDEYGQLAKQVLLDCAKWDPQGATGYRYNDEAGMPYAYYFSRTYTFLHDLLNEEERQICREVMKIRGEEMSRHLCPRHFWNPYSSHSNRAWHFLGEVGIAFQGEIEGADDWVWFAMNVFYNTYPVWSDSDGGWHEGLAYWQSYIGRFTWWADVMRTAFNIDAYDKPYFSRIGDYPMYLMPPGKHGGGFGDLTAQRTSAGTMPLMSTLAAQAGHPYWQWHVEQNGGPEITPGYIGFVRGALPQVKSKPPTDLPSSRCFHGTGQAYLNSDLLSAKEGVQIAFKSSPFGTQSHGYEANNSFLLSVFGERMLIRSGYRDIYGSDHHRDWMWSTRSVNNITVNGVGQQRHSSAAQGRIVDFHTSPLVDVVVGEAADAYVDEQSDRNPDGKILDRFTRSVVFVKPGLIVVYDRLVAPRKSSFEYWLHAINKFEVENQDDIRLHVGRAACQIRMLRPRLLSISQTNEYDPNPRERIKLREWHVRAATTEETESTEFITLIWPYQQGQSPSTETQLQSVPGGYVLTVKLSDGSVTLLLPTDDNVSLSTDGMTTRGRLAVARRADDGEIVESVFAGQGTEHDEGR